MSMLSTSVAIYAFAYLLVRVEAQLSEGSFCYTPLRDPGICINIRRCDGLISLLRTQSQNPEVRSYLMKSSCGYIGNDPLVCCPRLGKNQYPEPNTFPTAPPVIPTAPPTSPPTSQQVNSLPSGLLTLPNCPKVNSTLTRVVGGQPANLGQFPFMVALGYRNTKNPNQPKWLCGGSLITTKHVLTAGHCVQNRDDLYLARVGDLDLYSDDDGASPEDIAVIDKKVHEGYDPYHYTNDIAILTLANEVRRSDVTPVCLPLEPTLRSETFEGHSGTVTGWGSIYFNGPSSSHLQFALLPIVSTETCKNAFAAIKQAEIDDRVACAGYVTGSKDSCKGDSGGPLTISKRISGDDVYYIQFGIVSYGIRCAEPGYYGVYTRTSSFIDWISDNTRS